MPGLPSDLYNRCYDTLLCCDVFGDNARLRALFVDKRINPWRNQVPETTDHAGRVALVIDFLHDRYDEAHKNALVLFLYVVQDRISVQDLLYQELTQLVQDFEHFLSSSLSSDNKPPPSTSNSPRQPDALTHKQIELMLARQSLVSIKDPVRYEQTLRNIQNLKAEIALLEPRQ